MNFTTRTLPLAALIFLFAITSELSAQPKLKSWTYIEVDSTKTKWGNYSEPTWLNYFGLDAGDINSDGYKDILTGRWIYINPGGQMEAAWKRVDLGVHVDGILILDVDGDEYGDVIAQALPDIYWLEATNKEATKWKATKIATVPKTGHTNSQGFTTAQIIPGGKEEILIAGNGDIYCIQIPKNTADKWPNNLIAKNTSDEGIGTGDIDGDGDIDISAGRRPAGSDEPLEVVWFENPGDVKAAWKDRTIGKTNHPADRFAVADVDGDSKADIIVTEERWPGIEPDGNIFWYKQPNDAKGEWTRNLVATQYSTNNLDVLDFDNDGDIDLITAEHKGPNLELQSWINDSKGNFTKKVLDTGKESHLGTKVEDMDGDGDLDIVSIGWDQYNYVHLWRNEKINANSVKWTLKSTTNGDLENHSTGNQQTSTLTVDVNKDGAMDFFITERTTAPSVTLNLYKDGSWIRHLIDTTKLNIEAGSASYDIDGDGDEDIVFGGASESNQVWWWENPYPNLDPKTPWKRYLIKNSGGNKHHDQLFGDFDGDGKTELVFWNQGSDELVMASIPKNPKKAKSWPLKTIYKYNRDSEMQPIVGIGGYPDWSFVNEHEGLTKYDIDGDGLEDIVGGGRWFKYKDGQFKANIVDASYAFSRSIAAQFIEGGRPEILLSVGDGVGPLCLYQWIEWEGWDGGKKGTGTWKRTEIIDNLDNGHTLYVVDFNNDGFQDIFSAEMRFGEGNPTSQARILIGNGKGEFTPVTIAEGYGIHEGRVVDLDGDGDFDILGKPYTWKAPLINIWINDGLLKK